VVWGYVIILVWICAVAALAWLGLRSQSDDQEAATRARHLLSLATTFVAILLVATIALPVGKRPGVDTSAGASGSAKEGNVPNLVGKTAAEADDALDKVSLDADFREYPTDKERCRVVAQNPPAGGEVEEYGKVRLRCRVRVPSVRGKKANAAEDRMINAGLDSKFTNEPDDYDRSRCRVRSQSRSGSAPPDAEVTLRLRCKRPPPPSPTPEPEPTSDCDPNYVGACLDPNASDYDCAGGEGNGPEYTGPVTVVGSDHYDLNRDPDNAACEPYG
jgi:hypothetical protein